MGSPQQQESKLSLLESIVVATSPIINAAVSDAELIDDDVTEAVRALSQPALDGDDRDAIEEWVAVLGTIAELEILEKFERRLIKLQIKRLGDKNLIVADLLVDLGGTLQAQGKLEQSAMVYQAAVVMKNEILGEDDPQVADALFCMAEVNLCICVMIRPCTYVAVSLIQVRAAQGKYSAAVPLHEQALVIRKRLMYSRDQADMAISLSKLAEIMEVQDNHSEAINYYTQALTIFESVYGENSPFVAACMNSLALLLDSTGKSNDAKNMFQRCVAICIALYGEQHTSIASAMNNLALCLKKLGEYEGAHDLYQKALSIRRACYGEKHPAVATTLNNLGLLLKQQQRYEEAKALYLQALQIRREVLGRDHIDVASSLSNLAHLHEAMGSYTDAIVLHEEALGIRSDVLGSGHPNVAETLINIALLHKRDRNIDDARTMIEKAIEIYSLCPTTVGVDGELIVSSDLLAAQSHLKELNEAIADESIIGGRDTDSEDGTHGGHTIGSLAKRYTENSPKKISIRIYRAEHERLALSLRSMALALQSRGEYYGAQPFLEQSLGLLLAASSGKPNASEICTDGIVLLALLYRELGRYILCHDLLSIAVTAYTTIFKSACCPKVIDTMRELGKTSNLQQDYTGSASILSDALLLAKNL